MSINKLKNAWISNNTGLTGNVSFINEGKSIFKDDVSFIKAPSMSGANISSASISDTALSSNVPLKNAYNTFLSTTNFYGSPDAWVVQKTSTAGYVFANNNGTIGYYNGSGAFYWSIDYLGSIYSTGGLNLSSFQTINFGTNAPTMSGANISSASINDTALSSNIPLLNNINTFTNPNNFLTAIYIARDLNGNTPFTYISLDNNGKIGFYNGTSYNWTIDYLGNIVSNGGLNLSGNCVSSGSNTFTGSNTFSGTTTMRALYDQGITSSSNYSIKISNSLYGTNNLTSGYSNIIIGNGCLNNSSNSCNRTVAIGQNALRNCTSGDQNVAIGYLALPNVSNSSGNVGISAYALLNLISGQFNFGLGNASGGSLRNNCSYNYAIGNSTLASGTNDNVNSCIAMGYFSVANITSNMTGNVGIGENSLNGAGGGYNNFNFLSGSYNTGIGYNSGTKCSDNSNGNTFLGAYTDFDNIKNSTTNIPVQYNYSTAIGYGAIITGNNQIIVGTGTEMTYAMGGLNVPTGKTINFNGIAPSMSGANISSSSIPDSALSNNIITTSRLTSTLSSYVLSSSLTTTLSNYVLSSSLTSTLSDYLRLSNVNQTILGLITFNQAPSFSGANISSSSIPDSALSSAIVKLSTANTFTNINTFTGGITASATQTINFGTNAPTMSGANISAGTIDTKSLASTGSLFNHSFTLYNSLTATIPTSNTSTVYNSPANNTSLSLPILLYTFTIPSYWSSGTNRSITITCPVVLKVDSNRLSTGAVYTQSCTATFPTSIQVNKNGVLLTTITPTNATPSYQATKTMNMNSTLSVITYQYFAYEIQFTYVVPLSNNDVYTFTANTTFNVNNNGNNIICSAFSFITNPSVGTTSFLNCSYASGSVDTTGYIAQNYSINNTIPATLNAFVSCESITCASILNVNSTSTKNTSSTGVNGLIQITSYNITDNPVGKDGMGFKASVDTNNIINFANSSGTLRGAIVGTTSTVVYNTTSDERLKENIFKMPSQLENIKSLSARAFNWKSTGEYDNGFIAQEIYTVYPELNPLRNNVNYEDKLYPVKSDGSDFIHMIDYGKMTPYLWSAVQELTLIVERQQKEIEDLKLYIK